MNIERCESFEVILAETVKLSVTRIRIDGVRVYFEITSTEQFHGRIYPTVNEVHGLFWKSTDDIDPWLVMQLGRAIERYDA